MFFKTQIGSINSNGVFDTAGRRLIFIGDLPVKVGDWVFSDGKYVFGNAPPKGSPVIFNDEPSGIPVLADNLRGYFSDNAAFKKYSIKGERWISNAEKTYAHDTDDANIIDAEIAIVDNKEAGVYSVEKKVSLLVDDPNDNYHDGFYRKTSNTIFSSVNFGRIAVVLPSDDFSDVGGFQPADYYGQYRPFYFPVGSTARSSFLNGYYPAFENSDQGYGIFLRKCYFILPTDALDFSKTDGQLSKSCELIIKKDAKEFQTVKLADLLKDFEDNAKAEVDPLPDRRSVRHLKSRAIVRNFKILPDGSWQALIQAEIWASNTFYNESSGYPDDFDNLPFHISSTISHNLFLLKFNSEDSHEVLFSWKFLYPLRLRDATLISGASEGETTVSIEGAWVVRTIYHEYSTEIWRDYHSVLDSNLVYDSPLLNVVEDFYFPVQDDYHAKLFPATNDVSNANLGNWFFGGVFDANENKIINAIFPDANDAHKWNLSLAKLKHGDFLFGIRQDEDNDIAGALYKFDKYGKFQLLDSGLKNFRLRQLKKISYARR